MSEKRTSTLTPGRVVVLILGCVLLLPGLAVTLGSGALLGAYSFGRDDGWFAADIDRVQTPTAAVHSDDLDWFADPGSPDWIVDAIDLDVQLGIEPVGDDELFVGIGPVDDVDAYLAGIAHDEVVRLDGRAPVYERIAGTAAAPPPTDQTFWAASATGTRPTIEWSATSGHWSAVVMRADGAPAFAADVHVGVRSAAALPLAIVGIVLGAALVAASVVLIVVATRRPHADATAPPPPAIAGVAVPDHPVVVGAELDDDLSRWQWLVKWLLAIPHFLVLVVLWIGFVVATFAAGVVILFTGRYPERLFEFNLGVLRYAWRVSYYASSGGLGTDRYPPFSLGREPDYPAVLDIAYPEQLSRGLVLVKWWLLALPHYLILSVMIGGAFAWTSDAGDWRFQPVGGGLLGILVLVAAVSLLVTGRYPRSLFDLIIGLNRWLYRVIAYAALMTDRYPPFRLDQGGPEPGAPLPPPDGGTSSPADRAMPAPAGSDPGRSDDGT